MNEHLDRIFKLGFGISISWNEDIEIYYNANDVYPSTAYSLVILRCGYDCDNQSFTFSDMLEACCDLFYGWYNNNLKIIKKFDKEYNPETMHILEDKCLGDVTKVVTRELNIGGIID
jgi:hypothetical protein